jgi:hypothetical protein
LDNVGKGHYGIEDLIYQFQFVDTKMEKFAELIVREMCSVLDKAQWDKGEDWICADGTRIIPQIKEHFGVEE